MALCPICEFRNPDAAVLCENCGAAVQWLPGEAPSPPPAEGSGTAAQVAVPAAEAAAPPGEPPGLSEEDVQACPVCDRPNPPAAAACAHCGLNFQALERVAKGLPAEAPLAAVEKPRWRFPPGVWIAGMAVGLALAAAAAMAVYSHAIRDREDHEREAGEPVASATTAPSPGPQTPAGPAVGAAAPAPGPSRVGPLSDAPAGPAVERAWEGTVRGPIKGSAAAAGDLIVVGDLENRLYGFDLETGRRRWERELDGWVNATPILGEGAAFVATRAGTLYAVAPADGTVLSHVSMGEEVIAGPDGGGGRLFLATRSGLLRAVEWKAGEFVPQWDRRIGQRVESNIRAVGAGVLVATEEGTLMRCRGDTGEPEWRQSIRGFPSGGLAASDDSVVLSVDEGDRARVECRDLATGSLRWERALPGRSEYAPAAAGGNRVFVPAGSRLHALDAATGEVVWTFQAGQVVGAPAAAGSLVVFGGFDRRLRAVDAQTGRCVWTHELSWYAPAEPVVAAGLVVTGTIDRRVVALRASR